MRQRFTGRQQIADTLPHFGTQVVEQQSFRLQCVQQQTGVAPGSASELYDMAEGRGVA